MYKYIRLGFGSPIIEHPLNKDTNKSINPLNKYQDYISILLQSSHEWQKTTYSDFSAWDQHISDVENTYNIKFPLTSEEFLALDQKAQREIQWTSYGFDTPYHKFIRRTYTEFIEAGETFIVPIAYTNNLLTTVDVHKLKLPQDLLEYIKKGNAKLLIYQDAEGFLNSKEDVQWLEKFIARFDLNPYDLIVESANYNFNNVVRQWVKESGRDVKFKVTRSYEFEDRFWFISPGLKVETWDRKEHYNNFNTFLNYRRNFTATKHFMALNRRFSPERAHIFYNIHTSPILSSNSIYSLHNPYQESKQAVENLLKTLTLPDFEFDEINNYYQKEFNLEKGFSWDREDQHTNWAELLNPEVHRDSFINVVVETHQRSEGDGEIFMSEKSYRPIYCAQPFIIFGNPNTLKSLKEMGYKTFSEFWDESYDEPGPIKERFHKLYKTLNKLAKMPLDELKALSNKIEPILIHNFNVLLSLDRIYSRMDNLHFEQNNVTQTKLLPVNNLI